MQLSFSVLFTDRNECLESVDECSINASCMNTEGSYFCRCHDGFAGNGKSCKGWYFVHRLVLKVCTNLLAQIFAMAELRILDSK